MADIKDDLFAKSDNPLEFINAAYQIWLQERKEAEKELSTAFIQLSKEHNLNLVSLSLAAIKEGFNSLDAVRLLEFPFADMNLDVDSILELWEYVYEKTRMDIFNGYQYSPLNELARKQPDFTRSLLSTLLDQDKPFIFGCISKIFQELAKGHEQEIHSELCSLKNHNSVYVRMAVIDVLGLLNYKPRKNKPLLKQTYSLFEVFENEEVEDLNRIMIFAFNNLLKYSKTSIKKLQKFSCKNQVEVKFALARFLNLNADEYGEEKWFDEILFTMTNVSIEYHGIIEELDYTLYTLIHKKKRYELVESFLTSWILEGKGGTRVAKLCALYDSVLPEIVSNRDVLKKWVTKLLNSDHWQLNQASAEIIDFCQLHNISPFHLDSDYLKSLNFDDCKYICRKILGYIIPVQYACTLCFSILENSPRDKRLQGLIYTIFRIQIGENYWQRTIEFLATVKNETKSKIKISLADKIIKDIKGDLKKREDLPELNELRPSSEKSKTLFRESSKKMAVVMEDVHKKSIFLSLFPQIKLKYGTGSFHFMEGRYSEVSKLGKYSHSYELPKSEITHQVGAALERQGFRIAKRGG